MGNGLPPAEAAYAEAEKEPEPEVFRCRKSTR